MKFANTLFFGLLLLLVACGNSKAEQLMHKWAMEEVSKDVFFQFGENEEFFIQSANLDGTISKNNGSWKFGEDKKVLLITLNGTEQLFKIVTLTDTTLTLLPVGESMKLKFKISK